MNDSASHDLVRLSAVEQHRMFSAGEVSARELLDAHLAQIDAHNPLLNAIVGARPEVAVAAAARLDEAQASGAEVGPAAGLVTAYKDLGDTKDFVTTNGTPSFAERRPKDDSLIVQRMNDAGCVAVGKTNTPEFGTGSHTFNEIYGTTVNPWNPKLSSGGSSGGAAVALRAGMVAIADGSDLGGSLRNPAGWNNVIGFRPSPRAVPVGGAANNWNPMPISGPMARTIDDLALLLRIMNQPYPADPLYRQLDVPTEITPPDRPLRVAWSPTLGGLPVERDVAAVVEAFRDQVAALGWEVTEDEPDFSGADQTFIALRAFMYGSLGKAMASVIDTIKDSVIQEIRRGESQSGLDLDTAYRQLGVLWRRGVDFFQKYDLLLAPVTQVSPFPLEQEYPTEVDGQPMASYLHWMLSCCRVTTLGLPTMSLPAGFTAAGMPVGAQLIGAPYGDVNLLRAAKALETATGHGQRWPTLG